MIRTKPVDQHLQANLSLLIRLDPAGVFERRLRPTGEECRTIVICALPNRSSLTVPYGSGLVHQFCSYGGIGKVGSLPFGLALELIGQNRQQNSGRR